MPGTGLPTGAVAFVFSDIEGSTRLAHEQPQAFTSPRCSSSVDAAREPA
jgi:class 3 adenylate cyclase